MEIQSLPILLMKEDALEEWEKDPQDPIKCYIVSFLFNEGMTNSEIRSYLKIEKPYTLTHYKRVGQSFSEEQLLKWLKNFHKVKLGHMRAIAKLKGNEKEKALEEICTRKFSVRKAELRANNREDEVDVDIKSYERDISESTGRSVKIKYNPNKKTGQITLSYFGLDDLEAIVRSIGYKG